MAFQPKDAGARVMRKSAAALALLAVLSSGAVEPASASGLFAGMEGSWRGEGSINWSTGETERMRCNAKYEVEKDGNRLVQNLTCATDSTRLVIKSTITYNPDAGAITGSWSETGYGINGWVTGTRQRRQHQGQGARAPTSSFYAERHGRDAAAATRSSRSCPRNIDVTEVFGDDAAREPGGRQLGALLGRLLGAPLAAPHAPRRGGRGTSPSAAGSRGPRQAPRSWRRRSAIRRAGATAGRRAPSPPARRQAPPMSGSAPGRPAPSPARPPMAGIGAGPVLQPHAVEEVDGRARAPARTTRSAPRRWRIAGPRPSARARCRTSRSGRCRAGSTASITTKERKARPMKAATKTISIVSARLSLPIMPALLRAAIAERPVTEIS